MPRLQSPASWRPAVSRLPWCLWNESPWASGAMSLAYMAICLICTARNDGDAIGANSHHFWMAMAVLYAALAADRFFGALSRFATILRKFARVGGWYWPLRRWLQASAMIALCVLGALAIQWLTRSYARSVTQAVALLAAMYSVCLVILRAISLHEVDMLLYRRRTLLGDRRLNLLIESAGLILMMAAVSM